MGRSRKWTAADSVRLHDQELPSHLETRIERPYCELGDTLRNRSNAKEDDSTVRSECSSKRELAEVLVERQEDVGMEFDSFGPGHESLSGTPTTDSSVGDAVWRELRRRSGWSHPSNTNVDVAADQKGIAASS